MWQFVSLRKCAASHGGTWKNWITFLHVLKFQKSKLLSLMQFYCSLTKWLLKCPVQQLTVAFTYTTNIIIVRKFKNMRLTIIAVFFFSLRVPPHFPTISLSCGNKTATILTPPLRQRAYQQHEFFLSLSRLPNNLDVFFPCLFFLYYVCNCLFNCIYFLFLYLWLFCGYLLSPKIILLLLWFVFLSFSLFSFFSRFSLYLRGSLDPSLFGDLLLSYSCYWLHFWTYLPIKDPGVIWYCELRTESHAIHWTI